MENQKLILRLPFTWSEETNPIIYSIVKQAGISDRPVPVILDYLEDYFNAKDITYNYSLSPTNRPYEELIFKTEEDKAVFILIA